MEYKEFKEFIETIQEFDKYLDSIDNLGISLYETPISTLFYKMLDQYEKLIFNEEAIDIINWWLYEKFSFYNNEEILEMFDKDGNVIPTDTIKDLWICIKNNLK